MWGMLLTPPFCGVHGIQEDNAAEYLDLKSKYSTTPIWGSEFNLAPEK